MLFWMHLFIHLFKQSKPCIASTSELCILSGSNSDMFWRFFTCRSLSEQTSWTDFKYCHKKKKTKTQALLSSTKDGTHHPVFLFLLFFLKDILCVFLFSTISEKVKRWRNWMIYMFASWTDLQWWCSRISFGEYDSEKRETWQLL